MARLTVLLAPADGCGDVRAALHDWAAAGLVADTLWIEPAWVTPYDARALRLAANGLDATTVRTALADGTVDEVTLCVLVPVGDRIEAVTQDIEQALLALVSSAGALRVRVAFPRGETAGSSAVVAREFWHNLVVPAEDREGPRHPAVPIETTGADFALRVAATVAGTLGLWLPESATAVTGSAPPGDTARLVESYYRRLDATSAERSLRAAVLSTADGLPRPRRAGIPAVFVEDPVAASRQMAQAVWTRHRGLFAAKRAEVPVIGAKPINWRTIVGMFLAFMGQAVRNAPRAWLEGFKRGLAARAAGVVQGVVFGGGTAEYEVVVNGVTRDGRSASLLELNRAAANLERATQGDAAESFEGSADFASLWRDFCAGALTLADGGERSGPPPVQVGSDVGVVRVPEAIAPTDASAFGELTGQLGAAIPISRIAPYDVVAVAALERQLARRRDSIDLERETARASELLRTWRERTGAAYTVVVGRAMAHRVDEVQTELGAIARDLEAGGDDDLSAQEERQPRLARRLLLMLAVVVAVVAAVVVVAVLGVLSIVVAAVIAVLVLVLGVLVMVRTFWNEQRTIFAILHRREVADSRQDAARHNLRAAARDLRRLTDAYAQFLVWSRVLGEVIGRPFGSAATGDAPDAGLRPPLPRAMKIGGLDPDPGVQASLTDAIRHDLFSVGWLDRPWQLLIETAVDRVGPGYADAPDTPSGLYSRSAFGVGERPSFLGAWGETVASDAHGVVDFSARWDEILGSVGVTNPAQVRALMSSIAVPGRADRVDLDAFLAGVDGTPGSTDRFFDASLLSPAAASSGGSQVADSVPRATATGLSRVTVLTDLGRPIRIDDFAFTRPRVVVGPQSDYMPPVMPSAGDESRETHIRAPLAFRPPEMPSDRAADAAPPGALESSTSPSEPTPSGGRPRPGWSFSRRPADDDG